MSFPDMVIFGTALFLLGLILGSWWAKKKQPEKVVVAPQPAAHQNEFDKLQENYNDLISETAHLIRNAEVAQRGQGEVESLGAIQKILFPSLSESFEGYAIAATHKPYSDCSGDWYYRSLKNGKAVIWLGDVTGHGAASAMVSSTARTVLDVCYQDSQIDLNIAAQKLNRTLYSQFQRELCSSAIGIEIDLSTNEAVMISCGHGGAVRLRRGHPDDPVQTIEGPASSMLGFSENFEANSFDFSFQNEDILMLFSDGLIELFSDRVGGSLLSGSGGEFLKKVSNDRLSPRAAAVGLEAMFELLGEKDLLQDDVSVIFFGKE